MNRNLAEANRARATPARVLRNKQVAEIEAMFKALMDGDPNIEKITVNVSFGKNHDVLVAERPKRKKEKDMGMVEAIPTSG